MKTVFFGTPDFVEPILEKLKETSDVVLEIRKPQKFDAEFLERVKSLNSDLFVVAAYGQILPKELLAIPKNGNVNVHPSLLPKYRGPSPIQTTILNGDEMTGVSFIKMDEEVDHGPVIYQFNSEILNNDTFESLAKRLFQEAADSLTKAIENLDSAQEQDHELATFTNHLTKEDGFISLENVPQVETLSRMIRAYYPWPGVWFKTDLNGRETIIKLLPGNKIQPEGKKPMGYQDFKNGYSKGEEILKNLSLG